MKHRALPEPSEWEVVSNSVPITIGTSLSDAERSIIEATLRDHGGDKVTTARVLGISLKTLYNKLHRYTENPEQKKARSV